MCVSELQIGFSVTADWLRKWHKGFESINKSSNTLHQNQSNEIGVEDDDKTTNNDDNDWVNAERNKNWSAAN